MQAPPAATRAASRFETLAALAPQREAGWESQAGAACTRPVARAPRRADV